jgi:signal transduction histidine kinase
MIEAADNNPLHFMDHKSFLEHLPIAAYGVRAPDGVIVWFNSRATELWGRVPVLGDTDERFCGAHRLFRADGSSIAPCDTPVAFALATGMSFDEEEVIIERPDSSRVTVSAHVDPIRDQDGDIVGVVNFFDDISHRKRKEVELRELYEQFKGQTESLRNLNDQLQQENSDRRQAQDALQKSEERLRQLAESLEQKVTERTLELERRNAQVVLQSEEVRKLAQSLLRIQDEERRRIARELHDSAGQTLAALAINLDQCTKEAKPVARNFSKRLQEGQLMVHQLIREIRTTSYLLHPPLLEESGLSSALNWYVQGIVQRSDLKIELVISETLGRLPNGIELAIFRVVQECLMNIHRHSGSKKAFIGVSREDPGVRIEVRDQGRGISHERLVEIESGGCGVGIRGMQERLRPFRGTVTIESNGSGTRIVAQIPIPKDARSTDQESLQAAS